MCYLKRAVAGKYMSKLSLNSILLEMVETLCSALFWPLGTLV